MFTKTITSIEELATVAKDLIAEFGDQRVFAFYGSMGAGKTTFIQAICRELGSEDYITSPTFALVNEYSNKDLEPIYHFDFYRIKKLEEAFDMGYEEYVYSGNYCFIEWPEMIESLLPDSYMEIKIEAIDNETRKISASLIK